ncbi:hypothetical protein QWY75_10545 [Pontixanthobacter aestiaquae]|uniref:Uncharacterized protein n=1 Tax=Pontixanthobacter aestiaquae TaxID=1509367 RepID=A0A844Z900_9SPHN|nr:hypothetical protein [Pontixanthobacter aestiaquae]MDN3646637.1 hypothetical protein [Pontixanthobacter aestiaquae]MXO82379.1 hypothetical protein [Pontixanthobacter aestiaquae]
MTNIKLIAASLAATAMVAIPSVGAETADHAEPTKGEAKLARMLEGRVAGEPQKCIRYLPQTDLTVIDGTALVYRVGRTLYVNVPSNARSIDDNDILVRRTSFSSRLCNTDIITTVDQGHGQYTGNINLGEFVPYREAEAS